MTGANISTILGVIDARAFPIGRVWLVAVQQIGCRMHHLKLNSCHWRDVGVPPTYISFITTRVDR